MSGPASLIFQTLSHTISVPSFCFCYRKVVLPFLCAIDCMKIFMIVGTMAFYAQTHCSIGSALAQAYCLARLIKRPTILKPHRNPPDSAVLESVWDPESPQPAISPHMGNLLWENTQSRYLSLNFLISKSFIWKGNP